MTEYEFRTYWSEARASIESKLVPLAQKTNCIPPGATLDSLRHRTLRFERDDPKREAALQMRLLAELCALGDLLVRKRDDFVKPLQGLRDAIAIVDEAMAGAHEEYVPVCDHVRVQLVGYMTALAAVNSFRVKRGAKSRRVQGDATRERVKLAARRFNHLSRESAAVHIADEIGKSSGTIRRLLTELFPGDEWHKSIDLTQRSN